MPSTKICSVLVFCPVVDSAVPPAGEKRCPQRRATVAILVFTLWWGMGRSSLGARPSPQLFLVSWLQTSAVASLGLSLCEKRCGGGEARTLASRACESREHRHWSSSWGPAVITFCRTFQKDGGSHFPSEQETGGRACGELGKRKARGASPRTCRHSELLFNRSVCSPQSDPMLNNAWEPLFWEIFVNGLTPCVCVFTQTYLF